jgi:hypothetical protein
MMKTIMKQKIFMRIRKRMHGVAYLLAAGVFVLCCCGGGDHTTDPPAPEPSTSEPSTSAPEVPEVPASEPPVPEPSTPELPEPDPSVPEPSTPDPPMPELLEGKWKLAGIVDAETGILTELEPKDCAGCYTLTFGTDSTVFLYATVNEGRMAISDINDGNIPNCLGRTKVLEPLDGELYLYVHMFITSYIREGNELKFFYQTDEKKSYLLYKLVQS